MVNARGDKKKLLRMGIEGCPRCFAVSGYQLSDNMIVEMYLDSWRTSWNALSNRTRNSNNSLFLHEWLVPIPGLFHAEKQALQSICRNLRTASYSMNSLIALDCQMLKLAMF